MVSTLTKKMVNYSSVSVIFFLGFVSGERIEVLIESNKDLNVE